MKTFDIATLVCKCGGDGSWGSSGLNSLIDASSCQEYVTFRSNVLQNGAISQRETISAAAFCQKVKVVATQWWWLLLLDWCVRSGLYSSLILSTIVIPHATVTAFLICSCWIDLLLLFLASSPAWQCACFRFRCQLLFTFCVLEKNWAKITVEYSWKYIYWQKIILVAVNNLSR